MRFNPYLMSFKTLSLTPFQIAKMPSSSAGVCYAFHPVYKNYAASSDGHIYSLTDKRGKSPRVERTIYLRLKGVPDKDGYFHVSMRLNGKLKSPAIHVLVLESFKGLKPHKDSECAHENGIKTDNRISNLSWATTKINGQDKSRHGSHRGEKNPAAKLTAKEVLEIRALTPFRGYLPLTAKKFGVSKILVSKIRQRNIWKHL